MTGAGWEKKLSYSHIYYMIHFTPDEWLIDASYCCTAFGNSVWQPMANGESSGTLYENNHCLCKYVLLGGAEMTHYIFKPILFLPTLLIQHVLLI